MFVYISSFFTHIPIRVGHSKFTPTVLQPYVGWTFICQHIWLTNLTAESQN